MTRMRGVKPDLLRHEGLLDIEAQTGLPARLGFIALLMACDREGRFEWRPRTLKAALLPMDEGLDMTTLLDALESGDFIRRYEIAGKHYGWVPGFTRHQNLNNRESSSVLPPHPSEGEYYARFHASPTRDARVPHATSARADATPTRDDAPKGREGKGIGKEGKGISERERESPAAPSSPSEHDGIPPMPAAYPGQLRGWQAEQIVAAYPGNGRRQAAIATVYALLTEDGMEPGDLWRRVRTLADRWRALPESQRRYCPPVHTLFAEHQFRDDPNASPWYRSDGENADTAPPGTPGSDPEKKFPGGAAPEPAWDWRALFATRYGQPPAGGWHEQIRDVQRELRALHRQQQEPPAAA